MAIVSSTDGSPTYTCWNRRSSAGSFSTFSRYSSSVVAPIRRSSPRASMGFNILPASIDPSAAPAPTIVWISSMNVMIWPFAFLISLSTLFRRSSNSPRYLEPATMEPRSREISFLFCRVLGTSPATMRCARPSTTAVLPTPGSPISTGLFLVRRLRIWMTRRISWSRPMMPMSRCSVETYSSPIACISFSACASAAVSWRLACGCAVLEPLALGNATSALRISAPMRWRSPPAAWIRPGTTPFS